MLYNNCVSCEDKPLCLKNRATSKSYLCHDLSSWSSIRKILEKKLIIVTPSLCFRSQHFQELVLLVQNYAARYQSIPRIKTICASEIEHLKNCKLFIEIPNSYENFISVRKFTNVQI